MSLPDNYSTAAYALAWGGRTGLHNAAIMQHASAMAMRQALRDCAQIISGLDFPEGSPVAGYDVADIIGTLTGEFMPKEQRT